jgi:hypothetical protein
MISQLDIDVALGGLDRKDLAGDSGDGSHHVVEAIVTERH